MSDTEKINIVIAEICEVYNLSQDKFDILRRNIINRTNLYGEITPNFNEKEVSFIRNTSSVVDVLLNRLLNNIRIYDFKEEYDKKIRDKGTYTRREQKLSLESYESIKYVSSDRLRDRVPNVNSETLAKATDKVINHEFGHALQCSFNGINGNNNDKLRRIIDNLNNKYPNVFMSFNELNSNSMNDISKGMKVMKTNNIIAEDDKGRNFYSSNPYAEHLDEIFNDDEALKVTDINIPQFQYDYGNGFKKNIYNYESKNYRITSYARMMKLLMGKEKTYRSMYEDSFITYKFFDQFLKVSENVFNKDKNNKQVPPMVNILNAFENINRNNSLEDIYKLDLFFTSCLKMKVVHELSNPNIDLNSLNNLINTVKEFKQHMIKNDGFQLETDVIIHEIQHMIDEKYRFLNNNEKREPIDSINSNELSEDEKKDTNYLYNKILETLKVDYSKFDKDKKKELVGKVYYYEEYFIKNINEQEIGDYLSRIVNDLSNNKLEISVQNAIFSDLQAKFRKNNTSSYDEDSDGSNIISDIKEEYNKINIRYQEMLDDLVLDYSELEELIERFDKLAKYSKEKRDMIKNPKEVEILNELILQIMNGKKYLINYQSKVDEVNRKYGF